MQITFLSYFLAAIASYLGLLVGILLIKMAPEEQKPGRKYFIFLKAFFFFLITAFFLFFNRINVLFSLALFAFMLLLMANKKLHLEKSALVYLILGFVFYFSSKIFDLFIIESALIFLYGIPASSLITKPRKSNYKEILIKNLWFFLPAIILYFV